MGICKSSVHRWRKRKAAGCLENRKPAVKNIWWKTSQEKIQEMINYRNEHKEIATDCVVGLQFGISPTTVGKILAKIFKPVEQIASNNLIIRVPVHILWQKINACWSTDHMYVKFMGSWLYLQLLLEEYSRLILGWKLSGELSGANSRALIEAVINRLGTKPLVLKHDRGAEFQNPEVQGFLSQSRIIPLPSPAHYAPFNGELERTNRLVRRFTRPLEKKIGTTLDELVPAIQRGAREINDYLPRRIFNGRTSREIYDQEEVYSEEQREYLVDRIFQEQARIEGKYFLKGSVLDKQRRTVVESLQRLNLCEVCFGDRVKLFQAGVVS
jgi:hypothetical protein